MTWFVISMLLWAFSFGFALAWDDHEVWPIWLVGFTGLGMVVTGILAFA